MRSAGIENDFFRFHHVGLATRNPAQFVNFLALMGYKPAIPILDSLQNVILQYCSSNVGPDIELVSPTETPGPIDNLLNSRGNHVYHFCFEVDSINSALEKLKALGHRIITVTTPTPAVLFGGRSVGFYLVADFGLIELLECTAQGE